MMEDEDSSFVSNTDATICNTDDLCSSWGFSLISDPNIKASSSTTVDDPRQHQISTAATAAATDYDFTESGASSSTPSMHAEKVIRIFNVDFSQFSGVVVCNDSNNKKEEKRSERTRLVITLMFCAEAVQQNNQTLADALIRDIRVLLAIQQSRAMKKVATYFTEALDRRIHGIRNPGDIVEYSDYRKNFLQMHFYETSPFIKFAHFTANQAILEAFADSSRVHVIDLSLKNGLQWPALMQALALRPGGPPSFRLTGIAPDNAYDNIEEVGMKLAALARSVGVAFVFHGFVTNSLADVDALIWDFRRSDEETVAVNCVFELHHVLSTPGAIEKVLNSIREIQPKIVTIAEAEANHNGSVFLDRFNEAWHYYSTMFESMENSELTSNNSQQFTEHYLRWQINNVVACEGTERVERHETLSQWRARMNSSGFNPLHLGSNAFKQARMLMALFESRDGYSVEMNNGTLMLSWHSRPLIASSAWRPV